MDLIVSIHDLCRLSYVEHEKSFINSGPDPLESYRTYKREYVTQFD